MDGILGFQKGVPKCVEGRFMEKMQAYGIDGRFLRVCKKLYSNVGGG